MNRSEQLECVLELFTAPTPRPVPLPGSLEPGDAFSHGLRAFEHFVLSDFHAIADHAARALATATDPDARALARAVAGLAIAGWPDALTDPSLRDPSTATDPLVKGDPLLAAAADHTPLSPELSPVLFELLAEAALACARIDLAAGFMERMGPVRDSLFGRAHPYLTVMRVLRVRVLAFRGRVAEARAILDVAIDGAGLPLEALFAQAAECLVAGNSDERKRTRHVADLLEASGVAPTTALTRGCFMLAAYGSVAIGDVDRAVRFVLAAGGEPGLDRLMIVDRALSLELLASAAAAADDLGSAEAWLDRAMRLDGHPVAASTLARIASRVALLAGDHSGAIAHAERAIHVANADSRQIEAAEGEILLARARIAATQRGTAAKRLEDVVSDARDSGHLSVRRAASRELREVGRRLRPTAASGLDGLSPREVEVATRMAAGLSNATIARELFLSEHTVRIHVSRVLHAFGVATRIGVAAALATPKAGTARDVGSTDAAAGGPADAAADGSTDAATLGPSDPPPPLTPRQIDVVDRIIVGATNAQIAVDLGIGVKSVEKHVSEILRRWGVPSRVGIATIALSGSFRELGFDPPRPRATRHPSGGPHEQR